MAPRPWKSLTAATAAAAAVAVAVVAAAAVAALAEAASPPSIAPRVTQYWLVNATSGRWVSRLRDGDAVAPATFGAYAIAAISSAGGRWPVVFTSPSRYAHIDRRRPYALAWDKAGKFQPVRLRPGTYTVSAYVDAPVVWGEKPGSGMEGPPLASLTYSVTLPSVAAFWVMGADWTRRTVGKRLGLLVNGSVIDTAAIGQWSIEAEAPALIGPTLRVRFTSPQNVLEQYAPYMLGRHSPGGIAPLTLLAGTYTVAAAMEDWLGARGATKSVTFTVKA
ncbi:hypothetical protein MMPV_006446 [Pyropia vietnamensis]